MSKITEEADRIVKMTNDSRYMGYSFVSEAQRQAVNVLTLNKEIDGLKKSLDTVISNCRHYANMATEKEAGIKELAEALKETIRLVDEYEKACEILPFCAGMKRHEELAARYLKSV